MLQAERSIISTAVQAVSTTAEDLAAMLDNIKQQIEASDADQGGDTDQPWVSTCRGVTWRSPSC